MITLLTIGLCALILCILAWAFAHAHLQGEDHSHLDLYHGTPINQDVEPSRAHHDVVALLRNMRQGEPKGISKNRLAHMRERIDAIGDTANLDNITLTPIETHIDGHPITGEWICADNSDPHERLLYIHGGAFMLGSPKSHRTITTKLARSLNLSVFSLDYRMLPENKRMDCVEDCQAAYRWLMMNGPDGSAPAKHLYIAGDSAGGNLALVLSAWARDTDIQMPTAVIAMAPATDATLSSPTLTQNQATDPMLGPSLGMMLKLPRTLILWLAWVGSRRKPTDTAISPLHHRLDNLPPTLIHASEHEMLFGDARRYFNKARAAGSPVSLVTWLHMVHVWHVFEPNLPEAQQAFEHITEFVNATRS